MLRRIVIVGGGSAGWLTAGLIAAEHRARAADGLQVTLIESPDVPAIGVGEGTWPSMRDTLRRIGVSEADFFRQCDASFKQGSRFNRWVDGGDEDYYFHPFSLPQGFGEINLPEQWQALGGGIPFADLVSHQPHLCVQGRAPKQAQTPEFAAVANYGYHLDAGKFGAFLRQHCLEKLGVQYVPDHVVAINPAPDGDIASLQTQKHGALEGDLFIDCTGLQSLLLGKHYGVPLIEQQHVLYNDSALAVQLPYPADDYPIASQTSSTAQSAGWIWDIGLPTRRGVGHVYASRYISDDQAEAELRAYIAQTGGPAAAEIPTPRKLSFQPGYREKFWHRNCVAIGLSAGFIEPLEASALAIVEMSAAMLSEDMPATRAAMDIVAKRFNEAFTYRWERVIDFLKLHYVLSRRRDTPYWRDNTAEVPARLAELLTLWQHRAPSRSDFYRIEEVFPWASYQYILYGMGFRSDFSRAPRPHEAGAADAYFREAASLTQKMLGGLPDNRTLIHHIKHHGLPQ
ncbi:tryptophan 7-halogenase [Duganella sp. FT80W]|uniref:Tryptophan 7-halogenase n=1 Tax=Duganella guangzhouensis TaxID=2666084 RepID=A0A6I2LAP8_9BURK|nr:tryptophan halogenase family protein [Duganella guangzhouensis]MRW93904.1 tryptophan 7-halogenase [Duganella guangzhouensis]